MFLIAFEFIDCTLQSSTCIDAGSGSRPGGGRRGFRSGVSFVDLAVGVVGVLVVVVGVVGVVVNALRVGRETPFPSLVVAGNPSRPIGIVSKSISKPD
jgi:hypothetical protein